MSNKRLQCPDNNLRLGVYRCPKCGCRVQIFSDETAVPCTGCGRKLIRAKMNPCVEWCTSAPSCQTRYTPDRNHSMINGGKH